MIAPAMCRISNVVYITRVYQKTFRYAILDIYMLQMPPNQPLNSPFNPDPFGYKKVRYLGIALWLVVSAVITVGLILYQVPPIDILVEAAGSINDVIVANIAIFVVVWLALHVPLALLYWIYHYFRSWFTFN